MLKGSYLLIALILFCTIFFSFEDNKPITRFILSPIDFKRIPSSVSLFTENDENDFRLALEEFKSLKTAANSSLTHSRHGPVLLHHNKQTDYVVIMIHGLYESPQYLKGILNHFHQSNMNVFAPILTGHWRKKSPLMSEVSFRDWLVDIKESINLAKKLGKKIILAGFSNGGLLAIRTSLDYPDDIHGLILWSPAIYLTQETYWAIQYGILTNQKLNDRLNLKADGFDVADYSPKAGREVVNLIDDTLKKYSSESFGTAAKKREDLATLIKIPTFMTITEEDETAEPQAAMEFFSRINAPKSLLNFEKGSDIKHGNITKNTSDVFIGWESRYNFQFDSMMKSIDVFLEKEMRIAP